MIITWSRGRLGNQFFQYSLALEASKAKEQVVLLGFEELKQNFAKHRGIVIRIPESLQKYSRRIHRLAKRLAQSQWFGAVETSVNPAKISRSQGRLPICLVTDELAQIDGLTSSQWVQDLTGEGPAPKSPQATGKAANRCFIHVRRTDYLSWPRPDIPAILPVSWFKSAMEEIVNTRGQTHFCIFTDDPGWARKQSLFSGCEFAEGSAVDDWISMASCDSGILSPSSFAYWAAKIAIEKFSAPGPFIAPKYWGAWRIKEWYPPGLKKSPFQFLEVNPD